MSFILKENHANEVRAALKAALAKALQDIGDQAVGYVSDLAPVDTGRLAGSYDHRPEGDDTVVIGTNVEYAPYVEMGHNTVAGKWIPPKEHLKPGIMNHIDEYRQIAEEDLRNT